MIIPPNIKLYLDLAAVAIVAIFVGWFVHHERGVGRQEIQDADAKLVAATAQHNADAESLAATRQKAAVASYQSLVSTPVDHPISVRMCVPSTPGSGTVANDGSAGPGVDDGRGLPGAVGQENSGIDIGPPTDQILAAATAKVRLLQDYIRNCQQEGVCRQ